MQLLKAIGLACTDDSFRELLFEDPVGAATLYLSPISPEEIALLETMANAENATSIKDAMKQVADGICPIWPCGRRSESQS